MLFLPVDPATCRRRRFCGASRRILRTICRNIRGLYCTTRVRIVSRNTKIVATLGPACSDPPRSCRACSPQASTSFASTSRTATPRITSSARSSCASARRSSAARSPSWRTCRGRRSASASSPMARSSSCPGTISSSTAECELGDDKRVGLDYKELPRDVSPGAVLLLDDGLIRLHRGGGRRPAHRHQSRAGWHAVQQQGHQPHGRRPHRAGAHGQGHGRRQDRGDARGRLPRRLVPEEQGRHVHGAPAAARRRRPRRSSSRRSSARKRSPRSTKSSTRPTASWSRAATSRWKSATLRYPACRSG